MGLPHCARRMREKWEFRPPPPRAATHSIAGVVTNGGTGIPSGTPLASATAAAAFSITARGPGASERMRAAGGSTNAAATGASYPTT